MESKIPELGGVPGCVSPEPEITIFDWDVHTDYVLLACDGIFDVLSNDEVNDVIWETINYHKNKLGKDMSLKQKEDCIDQCVNNVLKMAMIDKSEDNVTIVLVVLNDFFV